MISFQYKKTFFNKFLDKRMDKIQDMSNNIDFNNLTYYFKNPNFVPTNFIGFRGSLHIFKKIKNSNISIKKAEEHQKNFKSKLNEITTGNPKYKEKHQLDTTQNLQLFL